MFHLITIGLGTSHFPGEKRRIPDGTPCYVFMQLLTPAVISTENGIRRVEVNDCILYQPRTPRILNAHDENAIMRNNWMFLEATTFSRSWINTTSAPTAYIIRTRQTALPSCL